MRRVFGIETVSVSTRNLKTMFFVRKLLLFKLFEPAAVLGRVFFFRVDTKRRESLPETTWKKLRSK